MKRNFTEGSMQSENKLMFDIIMYQVHEHQNHNELSLNTKWNG